MPLELTGVDEFEKRLAELAKDIPEQVGNALFEEAQIEKTESMRRTPVRFGALKSSHIVRQPEYHPFGSSVEISVTIAVGGPSAPYAIYVHENEEAFHDDGQAKFLESTIFESAPYMAQRVARRLDFNKA